MSFREIFFVVSAMWWKGNHELRSVREEQKRTVVMISHQLSAAAACDRILVLEEGRLVQQGHHLELLELPGTYRRLWDREQASEQLQAA